jgi:lipoprotein-anchoring transpeptidase ErfK/SrfK
LTKREVAVERDGKVIRRFAIGIGREDHPTPVGRYAVTDKLSVSDPSSPYGCCVVALTGHQTELPEGWPGGDRLAIHATSDLSGLGQAVSLGCMRTDPKDARWLMNSVPLGTPVFVDAPPAEPEPQRQTSQDAPGKR